MSLTNPYTNPPSQAQGYSNYYDDSNFIGAGVDNQIIDSQRCSILQGSSNLISGKYNCHIIGDYVSQDLVDHYGNSGILYDSTFNIGCYNGTYSWGPIFAKAGIFCENDAVFGSEVDKIRLGVGIYEGEDVVCMDFGAGMSAAPGASWNLTYDARINNGIYKKEPGQPIINNKHNLYISAGSSDYTSNLYVEGDVVKFYSSDKRLKDNILSIENCLNKIMSLDAVSFDWNEKQNAYSGHDIGLLAQQVNQIAPEIVEERKDGYLALKYEKMVPILVGAIQDQQEIINELKSEIETLKSKTNHL
jgi:hypothetical protein